MVEHLLIGDIAALLLVLGLTGPLLQPILAIPVFDRLRFLALPAVALPLWAVNLYFWHIPALYQEAYGTAPVHALEHTLFIFCGCLMWMPLVGPLPMPSWFGNGWRLGYAIGVRFTGVVLGNVLMWSGTVFYPQYAAGRALLGHFAADRPEHRGRGDDDRGHLRHPRGLRLALLPRRPRGHGAPAPPRPCETPRRCAGRGARGARRRRRAGRAAGGAAARRRWR